MGDVSNIVLGVLAALSAAGILACAIDSVRRESGRRTESMEATLKEKALEAELEAARAEIAWLKKPGPGHPDCRRNCSLFSECALLVVYEYVARAAAKGYSGTIVPSGWITREVHAELDRLGFDLLTPTKDGDVVSWDPAGRELARLSSELGAIHKKDKG